MFELNLDSLKPLTFINNKQEDIIDIEKLGWDGFTAKFAIKPNKLYKYYPNTRKYVKEEKRYRNYSYEALKNNTMYFHDAKDFDDSFDCAIDLDWDKFYLTRLKRYSEILGVDNSDVLKPIELLYQLSLKMLGFESADKVCELFTSEDELEELNFKEFVYLVFNNRLRGLPIDIGITTAIHDKYEQFCHSFEKFKIACFSTSPYLNRMWSGAYANDNKGFCVEYEIDWNNKDFQAIYQWILPVIYSQKRNDLFELSKNCDKKPTNGDLWQMFFNGMLRKSIYWADQQEWRIVLLKDCFDNLFKGGKTIPFYKITKVFLGNNMPTKARIKIAKYCRKKQIPCVGLIRDLNSFNLVECKGDCLQCPKTQLSSKNP